MFSKRITTAFFLLFTIGNAQEKIEVAPPENIKTILFKGPTEDQFPIVQLGESFSLEFDDLTAAESDYYYKIVHCDYNWTPSQLLRTQYLTGADNQRILDYGNSYNTLQAYSHYRLQLPNQYTGFKVSGNYLLEIYNNVDQLQFSRRFVIYENLAQVGAVIKRSRDFNYLESKQVVQIHINPGAIQLVNPKKEVKIAILQNYHWPTALFNVPPQFTLGKELVYKYDQETAFFAGNEYFNFDTKDLRAPTSSISHIELDDLYNHFLFNDYPRFQEPYTYFPDINGDFVVRALQGSDASREAEYTRVHFSFPYIEEINMGEVYISGKFNNYDITEDCKMTYNENNGMLEASILFKQGFYNYKYVIKTENGELESNRLSGNFHFTENNYLVLVYYRNFGDLYDSLIGIGNANSQNITN